MNRSLPTDFSDEANFLPKLQPVEGGGTGTGGAAVFLKTASGSQGLLFTDDGSQQRVVAQLRVIVEIFVAQTQRENPLADEFLNGMLQPAGVAFILEAGSQSAADTQTGVDLLQAQGASVAGEEPSGEIGDNFTRTEVLKKQRGFLTFCLAGVGRCFLCSLFYTIILQENPTPVICVL